MTNGERILSELTIEDIAKGIQQKYCASSQCEECILCKDCNRIFDILEKESGRPPQGIDVIRRWLNDV